MAVGCSARRAGRATARRSQSGYREAINVRVFNCPACSARLFFVSRECSCGQRVAYDLEKDAMVPLEMPCGHRETIACNWAPSFDASGFTSGTGLCRSCALTEVVPDLQLDANVAHWQETERAKRWVLANLARWGWFADCDLGARPIFQLLSEQVATGAQHVSMGHQNGVITINVSEADAALRTWRSQSFDEPLRTMIAHMRHELAHFIFLERLSHNTEFLEAFRQLFGDETTNYGAALDAYHAAGARPDWSSFFISAYASSHPQEDWAETAAHVLHLVDILDSFNQVGLQMTHSDLDDSEPGGQLPQREDAYEMRDADALFAQAAAVSIAVNHLNRSIGVPDIYPFVLNPTVREKLAFAHKWISRGPGEFAC